MKTINFNKYVPMPHTVRQPEVGEQVGAVEKDTIINFTIELPPRTPQEVLDTVVRDTINEHTHNIAAPAMSEREHHRLWNATPASLAQVRAFAHNFNFIVGSASLVYRTVDIKGTVGDVEQAFHIKLHSYRDEQGCVTVQRNGPLEIPDFLSGVRVFGIDERPMLKSYAKAPGSAPNDQFGYLPDVIARAYGVPLVDPVRMSQQAICLIELGGRGSKRDYAQYCRDHGYALGRLIFVRAEGAKRTPPIDPKGADGEVMLDICVPAGAAPGVTLIVIFTENTERGFIKALKMALNHPLSPSAISISWGAPESTWTAQAIQSIGNFLKECVVCKVKVLAAAGDSGAIDQSADRAFTTDFPSSEALAWSCGGTYIKLVDGRIQRERVWGEPKSAKNRDGEGTGGGISRVIRMPEWQMGLEPPLPPGFAFATGRMSPDWAFAADPRSGWKIRNTDGREYAIGGTSAVAPFCAAALACVEANLGFRLPSAPALIYKLWRKQPALFRDITQGSNGYPAGRGFDLCSGLGSVRDFREFEEACRKLARRYS